MLQTFQPENRLATLPDVLQRGMRVRQMSYWLVSWLSRFWLAQCRHAERPDRFVPRY